MADAEQEAITEKALSVDATNINAQDSLATPKSSQPTTSDPEPVDLNAIPSNDDPPPSIQEEETKEDKEAKPSYNEEETKEEAKSVESPTTSYPSAMLSNAQSIFESDEAKAYQITGSFKTHWKEYLAQPYITGKILTHDKKEEEVIHFANPLAPRRIYVGLKIKRISDVDNVKETYRCRFHIYFDWLLTRAGYESYVDYTKTMKNKKLEWYPPFRPRYEFLNIVEAHMFKEVDYGIEGPYRVQRIGDFDPDMIGFDAKKAFFVRMRLEVDATFCEELELENFPVDCQDFSVVMREGWGCKRAIFVPEIRTKKGKPSDFARVDPSFSVLDEWEFHNSRIEFRSSDPRESRSDTEYFMLTIRFKMRRRYTVYLWNIVLYMFFITLMSLSCFALHEGAVVGERMGLAVTLLLTAVAFQDIVFEELPNVAYLTLLHKYIICSFSFIAAVSIQTAMTAVDFAAVSFLGEQWFDNWCNLLFSATFVLYNLYFLIQGGWLRHWESQKLYMDSEELENYVEETKHQFKMRWKSDPNETDFRGKDGRIASFVDVDPLLRIKNEDTAKAKTFCSFVCYWIRDIFCLCIKCQCACCKCQNKSAQRADTNRQRNVMSQTELKGLNEEEENE